ncbi:evolutionarily conserved C-terminal region 7 [Striga hermonthica]|uniref:YTH domain-containing family protein n=1 Tax=Striga hermonthica TaxID=68872 RepID=A0A9N7N938_STRHE|nr:evolutionarily conserved C-terminal region 7 [Striga hermonthica]
MLDLHLSNPISVGLASPGMESSNFPDQGLADMYLIQGIESKLQFPGQFEQFEAMYNEVIPEYLIDQGLYYPTAANYGYLSTGFESAGTWEDPHSRFGLDGQEIHYTGAINEGLPYMCYATQGYGYGQYHYNPYNPYIPGAMVGVEGSTVAPQQYYAVPSYENPVPSPAYAPIVLQSRADANRMPNSFIENGIPINKADGIGFKRNLRSNAPNASMTLGQDASVRMTSEGQRANNTASSKQVVPRTSDKLTSQPSSQIGQVRGSQGTETGVHVKAASWVGSQIKSAFTSANGLSGLESRDPETGSVHKVKPKIPYGGVCDDERVGHGTLVEHNRGPRPNKRETQLVVSALTTRAGNPDAHGNITIFPDDYNKEDFPVEYKNAKFFVIKSYSEDDVHKSIKYNVWSSTPNGNKKLYAAYECAQKIAAGDPRGCPIFLFFSVNASGQFCGLAEMVGPVDFHRNMDFWQQDKWSGSFPVKWHIIKDLPNTHFRHIILENNEHKPVTNSRDTQEIPYKKGLDMLRIYKSHKSRTSLLDDFMYYENRQRIMQEERARLIKKSYENPYLVSLIDPPRKLQPVHNPSNGGLNSTRDNPTTLTIVNKSNVPGDAGLDLLAKKQPLDANADLKTVDELKMSSLSIRSDEGEGESGVHSSSKAVDAKASSETGPINVVTIGSMPVNVNGSVSSGILTVGTIPLDPRALLRD